MGVNVVLLKRCLFAFGAALAGLAGVMAGPITSVQPGMGEPILIMTLVVIVTGGIGSIRGAFFGAMVIGIADTVGRVYIPMLLRETFERSVAQAIGPALASIMIYLLMACVLALRPQGLFPVKHG
jgi:branched-chain amino acid transport system permease protein